MVKAKAKGSRRSDTSASISSDQTQFVFLPGSTHFLEQVYAIELSQFKAPWPKQAFIALLKAQPHISFYVAYAEGPAKVLGYYAAQSVLDEAELLTIAVHDSCQAQGLGQQLLNHCLHRVKAAGAQKCFLEVRPSNARALKLYQKNNFEQVAQRPSYYPDGEKALVLAKDLS